MAVLVAVVGGPWAAGGVQRLEAAGVDEDYGFDENENPDFVTLKYTPNGDVAWGVIFAGEAGLTDIPIRVAVDGAQNVFVAGDSHGGLDTYFDYATIRYRQVPRPARGVEDR